MPVNTNPYVFISYKREDRAYVKRLAGFLADQNISVWYDYELATGDRFARVIQKRIDGCVAVVAVMTPEAAASNWVLQEIDYAMQLGRRVLPLELRHYVKPITLVSLHHENVVGETLPSPSFVNQLRQLAPSLVPRSQQQRKSVTNPTPPTASALEPIGPGAAGSTTSGTHAGTSRTAPRGLADGRVKSLSEQSRVHTRRVEQHEASGPGRMAVEQTHTGTPSIPSAATAAALGRPCRCFDPISPSVLYLRPHFIRCF